MDLIDELFDLCKSISQPIIAIDGPAGAGKTTLAAHISAALASRLPSTTIHMDDLYNGWNTPFDSNFEKGLRSIVDAHKQGLPLPFRKYDWASSQYLPSELITDAPLLILEGCGSIHRSITDLITVSIWLEVDADEGRTRVLQRDGDSISAEMNQWLSLQAQHFQEHEPSLRADYVLTT